MWEMQYEGNPRSFEGRYANNKRCPICGQYIRSNERFYIIIIPHEYRSQHKKLRDNMMVHIGEWTKFCEGITSERELVDKLINHKTPRAKDFTEQEIKKIEAFKKACYDYDFKEEFDKPFGVKCKKRGTSVYAEYNVFKDTISVDFRGKRGLFDGFYQRQIETNIFNLMHKYLEDGRHSDYSASKAINEVFEQAKKTMEEIF